MPLKLIREGSKHRVLAYCQGDGRCPAEEFIDGLEHSDRKKMVARIEHAAEQGPPRNPENGKPVEGTKYFELKTHGQRLFWRWGRHGEIILMQGFTKRQDRIPKSQIDTGNVLFGVIEHELNQENA